MALPTKTRRARLSFATRRRRLLAAAAAAAAAAVLGGCVQPRIFARLYTRDDPNFVRVERAGRAIAVSDGMELFEGDFVETMSSHARIEFVAGGQVWLDVNTRVRVSSLWLIFGRIFAAGRFSVETEDVTASPEGTRFGVRRNRQTGDYAVVVETERVRCTGKRLAFEYFVPAGAALLATPQAKPEPPKSLSPGELQREIGWASRAIRSEPGEKTVAGQTGTILVAGAGGVGYTVYDAAGKRVDSAYTGNTIELMPGRYEVDVRGVRKSVDVKPGEKVVAGQTGTIVVAGAGGVGYTVYDAAGKRVDSAYTGNTIELMPGRYEVDVRGVRKSVDVKPGEKVVAGQTGTIVVAGAGGVGYTVYDAAGKRVDSAYTGNTIELMPVRYEVDVRGVRKSVDIKPGEKVVAGQTGTILVAGAGGVGYTVYDAAGKRVDSAYTGNTIELMPGRYEVDVRGVRQSVDVKPGEKVVAGQTGTILVAGAGGVGYTVYDAAGKRVDSAYTGNTIELMPGRYEVDVRGVRQSVDVKPGEKVVAGQTGTILVAGAGGVGYTVYDAAGKRVDSAYTGSMIELMPGRYVVTVGDRKFTANIEPGKRNTIKP